MLPAGIHAAIIEHTEQRKAWNIGDYWLDENNILQIRVSRTKTPASAWLVGIHETVESLLCMMTGVPFEQIDAFDVQWEEETRAGKHSEDDEPGDDSRAPYHVPHVVATLVERTVALIARVDWNQHEDEITALWNSTR